MATEAPNFVRWTSQITKRQVFTIFPDGCRDIVISTKQTEPAQVTLTCWDMRPRQIVLHPSDKLIGYRLRPGFCVDLGDLVGIKTEDDAVALLDNQKARNLETNAIVDTLGDGSMTPRHAARHLGVSLRSLQRQFRRRAMPPPEFWRLLGRARRAAIALSWDMSLADVAGTHGYSDQAHMTRALRHWFGHTPGQIKRNATLLTDINQPALGTWTGKTEASFV